MTEQDLERWTALVVAEARGRSLSPAARARRRQLEREQPELRGEASLWAEFAELDQPRPGERDDAAMIASVLAEARGELPSQARTRAPKTVVPKTVVIVGLLALAACVLLGLALGKLGELAEQSRQAVERGHDQTIGGAAMAVDDHPQLQVASPGEHELQRDDCRRAGASARLCTREQARFRVSESSTAQHVELEFEAGVLQIDGGQLQAEAPGHTFVEVRTAAGLVRIRGLVELSYNPVTGEFAIHVLAGEAELIGTDATPVRLGAGATLGLLAAKPHALESERALEPEPAPEPTKLRAPEPPKPTADELLANAQRALAAGETAAAIERYEQLIATFPSSHAARTACVSLGRLLLGAGRARDALATFDQYVDSGATELREEARYGRIRALRELGREAELDAAIAEFLHAHPGSIHRARLEAWRTP